VLNHAALTEDRVKVAGFHKPFVATTKIVDLLIEPLAHAEGIDLYERGGNLALSNLLHAVLPTLVGPDLFGDLLASFVEMVREPTDATLDRFYGKVDVAFERTSRDDLKEEMELLRLTRGVAEAFRDRFHHSDLDPAVPAFFLHASEWTRALEGPFAIIHDASKPIESEQIILEAMMSTSEEPMEIGYDRRKSLFPISATGIEFADSSEVPAVQVADVVASSWSYVLTKSVRGESDKFADQLMETRVTTGHQYGPPTRSPQQISIPTSRLLMWTRWTRWGRTCESDWGISPLLANAESARPAGLRFHRGAVQHGMLLSAEAVR
jgi:hypothetical protein